MRFLPRTPRDRRRLAALLGLPLLMLLAYAIWSPGADLMDGRHDLGRNGIWLGHGWLGDDAWFARNPRPGGAAKFRDRESIVQLAARLDHHRITDLFLHLCPASTTGELPGVDDDQVERFLDAFPKSRVMPWVGGVNGAHVRGDDAEWRRRFIESIQQLLERHPRFAGVQINVEPWPSGDAPLLVFLDELRAGLPAGKILSVAAYPPPTRWHPYPDVHWEEAYYREIARRCDQLAVMMYDTSIRLEKPYRKLMADWTGEVLDWSGTTPVLLGVATYDDADSGYHVPRVENLRNGLLGIHAGLSRGGSPPRHYQGVAIYCEWETDDAEWDYFATHFGSRKRANAEQQPFTQPAP